MRMLNIKTNNILKSFSNAMLLKLFLLLIVVLTLLSCGVYLGSTNREAVLHFEREYFGMNVGDKSQVTKEISEPLDEPTAEATLTWKALPQIERREIINEQHFNEMGPVALPRTELTPLPQEVSVAALPSTADEVALPKEPMDYLRINMELPVTIRLRVLVDYEYTAGHPDWMSKIQSLTAQASRIFMENFGMDLDLVGLGIWPVTTSGRSPRQLYMDLKQRSREGADVLLGFVNRELGLDAYALSRTSKPDVNGAFGILGKDGNTSCFFMGILRCISHLFGAEEVEDIESKEYQLGTWMSNRPLPQGHTPWIDAINRRRILENKIKPFAQASIGHN